MEVKSMAAQYTPISLPEMEQFLKRGFRALKPTKGSSRGEICYDLFLNETKTIGIRVMTSISLGRDMAAEEGADAIRVGFFNFAKGYPMIPGKFPIVKRTQNWKDSLKDRIEDYMEMFEEKEGYWESRVR